MPVDMVGQLHHRSIAKHIERPFNSKDPSNNASITALSSTSKPSFLLLDRVYGKLASAEDELWLLRALEAGFAYLQEHLLKSESLRYVSSRCIQIDTKASSHIFLQDFTWIGFDSSRFAWKIP
jgi:hypothetical protein